MNTNAALKTTLIDAIDTPFGRRPFRVHIHTEAFHVG
ncbi:hypothetical protein BOTU111922_11765 [Bordetella tumulicola]